WNTVCSRNANYDISLDGEKILSFIGFIDSDFHRPYRSKELDGGTHFLTKGNHSLTYLCTGKEPKAFDYLLNADNFILTPITAFHSIPTDTTSFVPSDPIVAWGKKFFFISTNPLSGKTLTLEINLDSTFKLGLDVLTI